MAMWPTTRPAGGYPRTDSGGTWVRPEPGSVWPTTAAADLVNSDVESNSNLFHDLTLELRAIRIGIEMLLTYFTEEDVDLREKVDEE